MPHFFFMRAKTAARMLFSHTRYHDGVVNPRSASFEVNNWIISDFVANELLPVVGIKPFPLNEQMLMVSSLCRIKPTHVFEWGTHVGKSAWIFHQTIQKFNLQSEVHSIDLPDSVDHVEHPRDRRGLFVRKISAVRLHTGDGVTIALELLKRSNNVQRPLFFLDGDHSYETVKRELRAIVPMVTSGSLLIHDTFNQSPDSGYNVGPFRAVQELLSEYPDRFDVLATTTGLPGMTLLNVRSKKPHT